jgi:hypothetical protein
MKKLIRIIFLLQLLVAVPTVNAQKEEVDFNLFKPEIEWFIDFAGPRSILEGKYNIYLVNFSKNKCCGNCITISYITSDLYFNKMHNFKYYTDINDKLVLFAFSDDSENEYMLKNSELKFLNNKNIIRSYFKPRGAFDARDGIEYLGITPSYTVCYKWGMTTISYIEKKYYEDNDKMPVDMRIFK